MVLRRVLVTGGASGIGAETCRVLAAAGWDPIAADAAASPDVVALDVTDEAAWDRVLDGVGPLAGLVNCAGIRTRSAIVDTSGEVAAVIEFLLSERASYITGEVLYVDGGWHAHA